MLGIVIWGAVSVGSLVVAAILANLKNRDLSFWMAWCFILPPMLFVLLLLPRNPGARPRRPTLDEEDRAVPH